MRDFMVSEHVKKYKVVWNRLKRQLSRKPTSQEVQIEMSRELKQSTSVKEPEYRGESTLLNKVKPEIPVPQIEKIRTEKTLETFGLEKPHNVQEKPRVKVQKDAGLLPDQFYGSDSPRQGSRMFNPKLMRERDPEDSESTKPSARHSDLTKPRTVSFFVEDSVCDFCGKMHCHGECRKQNDSPWRFS